MPTNNLIKNNLYTLIAILISCFGYYYFGYELVRGNFNKLLVCYSGLFLLFLFIYKKENNWKLLVYAFILLRIVLLFATPNLSQDFYRFIWDGRMILNGHNPYLYLPETYVNAKFTLPNQANELVAGMGELNASHYSNYPPLNQLCFTIAALFSKSNILGSIVAMRALIILADIGVLYFGVKLLKHLKLNTKTIFLYLLNPLIIIELTGNIHFEGLMIFFLIWSSYLIATKKWKLAAIPFASSVCLKLLPLLFLPLFFRQLKFKKLLIFYIIVTTTIIIFFAPFMSVNLLHNFTKSIGLWFGQFEFNGSIHNILKYIGKQFNLNNIVKLLGKITPILVVLFTSLLSIKQQKNSTKSLFKAMLFALSFYLFTSSTIHPWYLAMVLVLSIFTNYKFPLLWSYTVILSYSFYRNEDFINNYWLISLEYILVFSLMFKEIFYYLEKKKRFL